MKFPFTVALALASLAAGAAFANDDDALLVPNSHGGYNVAQKGGKHGSIAFFGPTGYASHVNAEARTTKPNFILKPVAEDVGHGGKIIVYKKIYFATPEEAEAARLSQ